MYISVIIPAFNEESGIAAVLDELLQVSALQDCEIIVVDDGSTDRTMDILRNYQPRVTALHHEQNKGYGAAIKTGVRYARGEFILITDADGTYPIDEIQKLLDEGDGWDMIVGARTMQGVQIPMVRRPAKWFLNKLANYLTNRKIPDVNSGLRVIRKSVLEKYMRLLPDGFSLTTTITLALLTNGGQVKYVPIHYHKRNGQSKIRPVHDTLNFLQLIIRTVMYFAPLKVFLPSSVFFFSGSFILLGYRMVMGHGFSVTSSILFICGIQLLAIGMIADLIDKRLRP